MSVKCLPCVIGYHTECWSPTDDGQCHCTVESNQTAKEKSYGEGDEKRERGGQIKDFADVTDLESTGRKRAAKLYPITKGMDCEWRGLQKAGGGVEPIIGCIAGVATNIHHGPDKNTLSNFVGNVHRICTHCHNRWHSRNDKYYSGIRPNGDTPYVPLEEYEWFKHDGVNKATPEQLAENEIYWGSSKKESSSDAETS